MTTPFERGQAVGWWTLEQVYQLGFHSVQECLDHQEQVYQEELASLSRHAASNPEGVAQQVEYLEGVMSSTRASLRSLLFQQGGV